MEEIQYCEHCGARLSARWERISPLLIHCLTKFYDAILQNGENEISISKQINFTKSEYNNFQKLRFHGLVAKIKDKSGYWLLTSRGADFLHGRICLPIRVKIFRNHIVEKDTNYVYIKDILGTTPYLDKKDDFIYEQVITNLELPYRQAPRT